MKAGNVPHNEAEKEVLQDDLSCSQHNIGHLQKDNKSKDLGVNWTSDNQELFFDVSQLWM